VIQRDEGGPEVLLGFIDVLHLLEIITDITARQLKTRRGSSVALDHENLDFSLEGEDLVSLLKPDAWEFSKPVGALIAHELRAKAHVFAPDTPVMQVVKSAFVTTDAARRVNRVAITNGQDPPLINDIISQTDVVNYMMGSKECQAFLESSVTQLHLDTRKVWTVHSDTPAYEALLLMREKSVSALGIVKGPMGTLVGNISASDLRGFTAAELPYLSLPVHRFLKYRKSCCATGQSAVPTPKPIACAPEATLRSILEKMQAFHVHRVYVVDTLGAPLSVVAMSDILRVLTNDTFQIPVSTMPALSPTTGPNGENRSSRGSLPNMDMDVSSSGDLGSSRRSVLDAPLNSSRKSVLDTPLPSIRKPMSA
jgi:CBS domain-containing protein